MRFFVHSSAARWRRWLKLQSNEFEPRWVQLPSFIQISQSEVGERARTPDKQTDTSCFFETQINSRTFQGQTHFPGLQVLENSEKNPRLSRRGENTAIFMELYRHSADLGLDRRTDLPYFVTGNLATLVSITSHARTKI